MRYLSLFSGIEACSVAWKTLGWTPVAFSEIEEFPKAVLKHYYPNVPDLGDVTKITEEQVKALGHIDLVVGGSPCQDLSLAGNRAGLRNEDGTLTRSGLYDYQIQIFEWARKNNGARFMLYENVYGAVSSNSGRDYAYILGTMVKGNVPVPKDGWRNSGICVSESGDRIVEWTVLNSEFFGVPQRRRRLFALLDTGDWFRRQPILFESEGLQRDSEPSKEERKGIADNHGDGTAKRGRVKPPCYAWKHRNRMSPPQHDVANTVTATDYKAPDIVCWEEEFFGNRRTVLRRITPLEAERLQGFPDNYTDIPWKGKEHSPIALRYMAVGNSMSIPVMRWIADRIDRCLANPITEDTSDPLSWQPTLF